MMLVQMHTAVYCAGDMMQCTYVSCKQNRLCAQVTTNYWLLQHGMSIGIGDTVADDSTMTTINEIIEKVHARGQGKNPKAEGRAQKAKAAAS
eukprot:1160914-Pelagomonas_calceolata.AAC.11